MSDFLRDLVGRFLQPWLERDGFYDAHKETWCIGCDGVDGVHDKDCTFVALCERLWIERGIKRESTDV